MEKKFKIILVVGLFLRLILAAITYHSDIVPFPFAGDVIGEGNVSNLYDYLWDLPEDSPELKVYPRNLFNWPPASYFTLGTSALITTTPFGQFTDTFIYRLDETFGDLRLNIMLVFLKLPYLPFDLGVAYILMKFFGAREKKFAVFALWMLNPINLYATYMMGTFDIIPTFFVMASIYMVIRKPMSLVKPALLLGLGAMFKIFPIMFLVPLAGLTNSWKERFKIFFVGAGVYVLSILPFVGSSGFRRTALVAGQTTKSFYLQLPISGGEAIIPYLALLVFVSLIFLTKKGKATNLWKKYFLMLLLFLVFTHYHPQWFLWITPFLILDLVISKYKKWPVLAVSLFSFFGLITLFDSGLSIGLFAPIAPHLYRSKGIWELVGLNLDINYSRSILQTLFAGAGLYWFVYYRKVITP